MLKLFTHNIIMNLYVEWMNQGFIGLLASAQMNIDYIFTEI